VSVGREASSGVFMETKVELGFVLDNGFVKRGEKYEVFFTKIGDGDDEESVVFTSITTNEGGTVVSPFAVRPKHLAGERFFEVTHQIPVELNVAHGIFFFDDRDKCTIKWTSVFRQIVRVEREQVSSCGISNPGMRKCGGFQVYLLL
jgi:hypothetical protein